MAHKKKKNKSKNSTPSPPPPTTTTTTSSSSNFSFQVVNTSLPQTLPGGPYQINLYQIDGPKFAFEAKTVEEGFYVKIDMPGVGKDTLEVNYENKKISFSGKAPQVHVHDSPPRNYHGEITFSLEPLEVSDVKVEMNNGVLRVVLVGSGFPPNYNASSSHPSRKSSELSQSWESITNGLSLLLDQFRMLTPPAKFLGMYPFQLDGPKGAYEMRGLSDDFCFLRVDMPDVDSAGLKLRMTERRLYYGGNGVKGSEYDEGKRLYFGEFIMNCPCDCNLVDMNAEITDGVLRVFVEKVRVESTERVGDTNCFDAGPL